MAMSRSDAADFLAGSLKGLLASAEIAATDDPGELKEVIDEALLTIGAGASGLATDYEVSDDDVPGYRKVLRYFGLLKIQEALGWKPDFNISSPGVSKSYGGASKNLADMIEKARIAADPFVTDSGAWGTGVIVFDYQEPVAS